MLTILNDPAGITGRQQHELDYDLTLQANIERHLEAGGDCELLINGVKVDPLNDPRLDAPPSMLDLVTVIRRPAGVETWLLVASLALSVYSIATAPRPEDAPISNDSPNNRLTGQTNIARAYQAVPDVYGRVRVWPDLIQQSTIEYVDHVKRVTEWLCISRGTGDVSDVLFADSPLAEGDSSFTVYKPLTTPSAYPELNDTIIENVLETFASPEVNGQEITDAIPPDEVPITGTVILTSDGTTSWSLEFDDSADLADLKALSPAGSASVSMQYLWTRDVGGGSASDYVFINSTAVVTGYTVAGSRVTFDFTGPVVEEIGTQTLTPPETFVRLIASVPATEAAGPFTLPADADRILWNVVFLRGLKGTVEIEAEWWQIDGDGVEIGGTRETQTDAFTADTYDQRFFSVQVTPTAGLGRYRVQFTRITADLGNGADVAKLEGLFAGRFYATKTLPGVTVIRVTTTATQGATSGRERKFNCIFQRHVRTLSSTTLSASRNFARSMAHLWCVAGGDIAELDTTKLAAINTALGETSPLLRFDGTLDDADMSMGQRLQLIADTARCKVWRDGTKWTVTREQAQATHELQLDYRNLAANGDSQITYDGFLPASSDGVEVEYTDETTLSTRAYVRLTISGGAVAVGTPNNPRKIRLPGCATEEQAENRAHLEARRLLYQRTHVTDSVLADGGLLGLGMLVRWVDPNDFAGDDGLQAGEVLAIAGSTITTSEPLDWKGETSGRMQFTGVDGAPLGAPVVVTAGPAFNQAVLASVPAGLYVADGATSQLGSRYAFGVGFTQSEMEAAGLYVVDQATPGSDRTVSIALSNYDERMFEED